MYLAVNEQSSICIRIYENTLMSFPNYIVLNLQGEDNTIGQTRDYFIYIKQKPTISSGLYIQKILAITYLPKTKGLSIFGA